MNNENGIHVIDAYADGIDHEHAPIDLIRHGILLAWSEDEDTVHWHEEVLYLIPDDTYILQTNDGDVDTIRIPGTTHCEELDEHQVREWITNHPITKHRNALTADGWDLVHDGR